MAYEWKPNECDPKDGIPYVKKASVVLEKDGKRETFTTQEAVTAAWADGWHDTGRPETADVRDQETLKTSKRKTKANGN